MLSLEMKSEVWHPLHQFVTMVGTHLHGMDQRFAQLEKQRSEDQKEMAKERDRMADERKQDRQLIQEKTELPFHQPCRHLPQKSRRLIKKLSTSQNN